MESACGFIMWRCLPRKAGYFSGKTKQRRSPSVNYKTGKWGQSRSQRNGGKDVGYQMLRGAGGSRRKHV